MDDKLLHINPKNLSHSAVVSKGQDPKLPSWQRAVFQFLSDWQSDNESITLQTSGSTGKPKSIKIKKARLIKSAEMTGTFFGFESGMTVLSCLPAKYIAGKMMLVRAIVWDLNVLAVEPSIAPMQAVNQPIDFAAMTPQQAEASLEKLPLIDTLIIGGGPVSSVLQNKLQGISTKCYATYGMTETLSHIALKKLNGPEKSAFYTPLGGVKIGTDTRGCLQITAPKLLSDVLITNDLVKLYPDGKFKWLGRIDHVINSGGIKLHPEVIESKLQDRIYQPFFIAGIPDSVWGEVPVLVVEGPFEGEENDLFSDLEKAEKPKAVYTIARFKRTPNGKIKRKATLVKILQG